MSNLDEIHRLLCEVWDDGNASGLDGWVGSGRGTEPIDDQAIFNRDRCIHRVMGELARFT